MNDAPLQQHCFPTFLWIIAALALVWPPAAGAADYYVSKTGDDAHDGRSRKTSFLTVGKGVAALAAGDTLHIGPGEYAESVSRTGLGSQEAETVIRAEIPGTVLLRGDVPLEGFTKVEGHRFIYSTPFSRPLYSIAEVDSLQLLNRAEYLEELEFLPGTYFYDAQRSTLYFSSSDLQPPSRHHYRAAVSDGHGLHLEKPLRVTVSGIAATGFNLDRSIGLRAGGTHWGILFENATGCTIRECTAYLNGGGISFMGRDGGGGNTIEDCTAYANNARFNTEGGNIGIYRGGPNDLLRRNYVYRGANHGQRIYGSEHGYMKMQDSLGWGNNGGDFWLKGVSKAAGPVTAERIISLSKISGRPFSNSLLHKTNQHSPEESTIYLREETKLDRDAEFADHVHFDFRLQKGSRFSQTSPDGPHRGAFPQRGELYFVTLEGNDAADGQSVATAWKTLAHALKNLKKGDTLYLSAGSYPEAVSLKDAKGISIRQRGKGAVILSGTWTIKNSTDLSLHRLTFTGNARFTGGRELALDNCAFLKEAALEVEQVKGLRITHSFFEHPLKLSESSKAYLSGNLYAAAPGLEMAHEKEILYSNYNSYGSRKNAWKVGSSQLSLKEVSQAHDQYSISAVPEFRLSREEGVVLGNALTFAAAGPFGTAIGLYFEGDLPPLRTSGPFVHSTSDTTANIEWWTSFPAESELAWGETPECENRKVFDHHNYASYSLTGLTPGKTYYYRVTVKEPAPGLALSPWIAPPTTEPVTGKFTTAEAPVKPREWYVAQNGDNANDGLSRKTAWRTLNHAAGSVGPGDTVWVAGGTYHETVWLRATGEKERPITFRALPGERVSFDGVSRRLFAAFVGLGKHHLRFDSFYSINLGRISGHDGALLPTQQGGMYVLHHSGDVEVHRSLMDGRGTDYSPGLLVAADCDGILIKNSVAIAGFGRTRFDGCRNIRVEHSVFYRNLINQMQIFNSAPASISQNIFTDGLPVKIRAAIVAVSEKTLKEENNCFFPREPRLEKALFTDPSDVVWKRASELKGTGSIIADPQFAILQQPEIVKLEKERGDKWYPVDHLPDGPRELKDFLATNPEVVERGMGLQPEAILPEASASGVQAGLPK